MKIYKYSITLYTQMGEKNGTLTRYTECGSYSEKGFIEILGEKNPYLARVEPCGKCSMSGTLKTIVSDHNTKHQKNKRKNLRRNPYIRDCRLDFF